MSVANEKRPCDGCCENFFPVTSEDSREARFCAPCLVGIREIEDQAMSDMGMREVPKSEPSKTKERPFPNEKAVEVIFQKLLGAIDDDELEDLAAWSDGVPDTDPNSLHSKLQDALLARKPELFTPSVMDDDLPQPHPGNDE